MLHCRCASIRATLLTLLLVIPFAAHAFAQGKKSQSRQVTQSTVIRWSGQPGINRYRLQLARDERFTDIVLDRAVTGREYTVTELPSGSYFWRVAPAAGETGAYSSPAPVTLGSGAASDGGGTTTTGTTPKTLRPTDN